MTTASRRTLAFALLCATLVVASNDAHAQRPPTKPAPAKPGPVETTEARAQELKDVGDRALDTKRYEDAVTAYAQSYALVPNPTVLYNRGRALQFLARYADALDAIESFDATAPPEVRARVPGLRVLLDDLRRRVATVAVRCSVNGARVLLDQKQVGTCPVSAPLRVNAGKRVLEAFADGYFPFRRDVELPAAETTALEIQLTSREDSGLVLVKSGVPGAEVAIDDHPVGMAPAEVGLAPGAHRVRVDKPGFSAASTQVVVARGERKELSLDPTEKPSLLTRWWFWTGIGVVAAGAATTIVLVTTERAPHDGDFSPGRVSF